MSKQIYIDSNGNEVLVSGTITNDNNLPHYTGTPTAGSTAEAIGEIGTTKYADWTANSSSAYGTACTDSITISKGTWVISWGHPNQSADIGLFLDGITTNSDVSDQFMTYDSGVQMTKCSIVVKFTGNATITLKTGGGQSVTFSNITRGFLRAVKVSA